MQSGPVTFMRFSVTERTALLVPLFFCGCGHGPAERYGRGVDDYATSPRGDGTVAIRSFAVSRPAIGLSAMPDGGIAKILDGGIEVNVCTKASQRFQQVAVVHEPTERLAERRQTPEIVAWRDSAVSGTQTSAGDTLIILPQGIRTGSGLRPRFHKSVIPECQAALDSLNNLKVLPDGSPVTDNHG
jgi:hypothetical protein